jgi:hypothetical protein
MIRTIYAYQIDCFYTYSDAALFIFSDQIYMYSTSIIFWTLKKNKKKQGTSHL